MDKNDNQLAEQLGPPAKLADGIRSGYRSAFSPSLVCLIAAIFFAFWHQGDFWMVAAGFLVSALVYFPVGLSQYRRQKQIGEKVIRNYEIWYKERNPGGGHIT